jgi:hypothetical protein
MSIIYINTVLITSDQESIKHKIVDNFLDGPKKQLFQVYHFLFNKEYDMNSKEGVRRDNIFKQTLKSIKETNEKNLSYTLSIDPLTDMTDEELKEKMLTRDRIERVNSDST